MVTRAGMEMGNRSSTSSHEVDDLGPVSEETWEKLLGINNWEGLLEPSPDLRKFILRCGFFCHAAYDAFCGDKGAEGRAVSSGDVHMPNAHRYKFHDSLYAATPFDKLVQILAKTNSPAEGDHVPTWMGYCAATTDEVSRAIGRREIYIAWRGTERLLEWMNNFSLSKKASAKCLLRGFDEKREDKPPKVMKNWLSIYTSTDKAYVKKSARDQLKAMVGELLETYKGEKISIVITGHSLGGVLAILSAFDLVENSVGRDIRVAAVVFHCPNVGDRAFKQSVEQHINLKILHIKNTNDIVSGFRIPRYVPLGSELAIDTAKSSRNPVKSHDLKATLHMVAKFEPPINTGTELLMQPTKPFRYVKSEIKSGAKLLKKKAKKFIQKTRPET